MLLIRSIIREYTHIYRSYGCFIYGVQEIFSNLIATLMDRVLNTSLNRMFYTDWYIVIPLKKGIMLLKWGGKFVCLCVCVCLSVCHHVWLHSAIWCQMRSILSTRTRKCDTCQDHPFPYPDNMDHPDHITFWPITSKLMNKFTSNFTCV